MCIDIYNSQSKSTPFQKGLDAALKNKKTQNGIIYKSFLHYIQVITVQHFGKMLW